MGGQQSRGVDDVSSEGEPDSWMNRVSVNPSPALIARLQERQHQEDSNLPADGHSETSADDDKRLESEEESNHAVGRRREQIMRREENADRVRELFVAKETESAKLSGIVSSVVIPDLSAERQTAVCAEESQAVIKCYASLREGAKVRCGNFVSILEACASSH